MTDQEQNDSLFSGNDATEVTTPSTSPQEPTRDGGSTSPTETLVGEGKKFKTIDDLARGKLESDAFIAKLQSELAEMRSELNQRLSVEDALRKHDERYRQPTESTPQETPAEEKVDNRGVSQEEIEKFVLDTIEKRDAFRSKKENLQSVKERLQAHFGADYRTKVREKLNSLSLGEDFANGLAATQPKAFLELVGVRETPNAPSYEQSSVTSSVRLPTSGTEPRNYGYYRKLQAENPKEYFSQKVQMQMHKDAQEQGESFFNT